MKYRVNHIGYLLLILLFMHCGSKNNQKLKPAPEGKTIIYQHLIYPDTTSKQGSFFSNEYLFSRTQFELSGIVKVSYGNGIVKREADSYDYGYRGKSISCTDSTGRYIFYSKQLPEMKFYERLDHRLPGHTQFLESIVRAEHTKETKQIAGYHCKKAIVYDHTSTYYVFFTNEIKIPYYSQLLLTAEGIDGVIMEKGDIPGITKKGYIEIIRVKSISETAAPECAPEKEYVEMDVEQARKENMKRMIEKFRNTSANVSRSQFSGIWKLQNFPDDIELHISCNNDSCYVLTVNKADKNARPLKSKVIQVGKYLFVGEWFDYTVFELDTVKMELKDKYNPWLIYEKTQQ